MRRYLAVFALVSAFVLTGARHSSPPAAPTPTPVPTPAPTPVLPVVVIYPFQVNGDTDKDAGMKMAALMVTQMASSGQLLLKPISKTPIPRADYLTNAVKVGADYYISGYLTPVGEEISLVEQVVSTTSGTIVWSNTAQVLTYGDALTQAGYMNHAIVSHSGRVEAEYRQQQALSTPSPGPVNGTETSISRILGLLHRGSKSRPAVSANQKPQRSIIVVGGGAGAGFLKLSMERAYNVTKSAMQTSSVSHDAKAICGAVSNATIASGDLTSRVIKGFPASRTEFAFTLNVHRCDGSVFFTKKTTGDSAEAAVDAAVDAFIGAHPANS